MNCLTTFFGTALGSCVASTTFASGHAIIKSIPPGRFTHAALLIAIFGVSWVFYVWAQQLFSFVPQLQECEAGSISFSIPLCYAVLSVQRLFFSFVIHQLLHMCIAAAGFSTDYYWPLRFFLYALFLIVSFVLPNAIIVVYSWIGAATTIFFAIAQLISILDAITEKTKKWVNEQRNLLLYICFISLCAVLFILIIFIFGFHNNVLPVWLMVINVVAIAIAIFLSIQEYVQDNNQKAGGLEAASGALLSTLVLTSAILFGPQKYCKDCSVDGGSRWNGFGVSVAIIEFIILFSSVIRFIYYDKFRMPSDEAVEEGDASTECNSVEMDEQRAFFHLALALAAIYLGYINTEWISLGLGESIILSRSIWLFWIRVATSWSIILLYIWTVVSPLVYPDRDWN